MEGDTPLGCRRQGAHPRNSTEKEGREGGRKRRETTAASEHKQHARATGPEGKGGRAGRRRGDGGRLKSSVVEVGLL